MVSVERGYGGVVVVGHVTFQLLRAEVETKVLVSHCRGRKAE